MSVAARVILLASAFLASQSTCFAQLIGSPAPLTVSEDPPVIQAPAYENFIGPQCDSDGTVYLRHETPDDNSWVITSVEADGSAQQTQLAPVPGFEDMHTFALAVADGGSVQEIVRAWSAEHKDDPLIYYLRFDVDGNFRSRQAFANDFVPSTLLPLPSGNFFAAGVVVKKVPGVEDVEEAPIAGIFGSDARLKTTLGRPPVKLVKVAASFSKADSDSEDNAVEHASIVRLGDDGNIYALLTTGTARVRVFSQSGRFRYELKLQEPFEEGTATGFWVSGGRLLVTYEGEAGGPNDAITYLLYDAETGELIRAYRPQFSGTVACFQDGQTLTVLLPQKHSGTIAIGTAELQ